MSKVVSGEDGDVCSCTLLTTDPNAEVRGVGHHRMPVLLTSEDQYARWLDPETVDPGGLADLMRPAGDGALDCYPAQKELF